LVDSLQATWPEGKRAALTLDIDDIHPEGSHDLDRLDFGGDRDAGAFRFLNRLRERWPQVAITLFVTPDWIGRRDFPTGIFKPLRRVIGRLGQRPYASGTFALDHPRHAEWVGWFREKVSAGGYEVALHGLRHFNSAARFSGQEFIGQPYQVCHDSLARAEEILERAGFGKPKGFRPPGWGVSPGLLATLRDRGYRYGALSNNLRRSVPDRHYTLPDEPDPPLLGPCHSLESAPLLHIPANCLASQIERACQIVEQGGQIVIHTHIARTLPRLEHVGERYLSNITRLFHTLEQRYPGEIWYATHAQVADHLMEQHETYLSTGASGP
jgi:peptidoglycan/xylan/chitin deacetylase (PgdA/CDA1 family)